MEVVTINILVNHQLCAEILQLGVKLVLLLQGGRVVYAVERDQQLRMNDNQLYTLNNYDPL